ncbi:CDGSH iron-sulfur domain-containing protein [Gordonia polyisoprenivorans]|uniref:CDGSH iron-sulfur domain-containing protein n=1 Tax=Gordonia polyisoprenivorans TaxID=84595 RepID=UPI0009E63888|nr:CDGSH iron-sulfur domain-containing protein [Gordonia polyisoprenivorans]
MATPESGSHYVDRRNSARITVTPGGPLVVRGDVDIVDAAGTPVPRRRATVALCRCGRSGIQPYCDGSHVLGRSPIHGE